MRPTLLPGLILALSSIASVSAGELSPVAVRAILEQPVAVHGSLNFDAAGGQTSAILYPVGNAGLAGLVVAVAAHAMISSSAQNAEKQRIRDKADAFLLPHRPALEGFKVGELVNGAVPLMSSSPERRVVPAEGPARTGEVVLETVPTFYVTQDGRALVLENVVLIRTAGQAEPVQKSVRVVSPAQAADGALPFWFDRSAANLRETGARMLARSLDLALNDLRAGAATGAPAASFKTVRYREGGQGRMERAQVLNATCQNLTLRTLRGNLMVVPRDVDEEAPDPACSGEPTAPAVASNTAGQT